MRDFDASRAERASANRTFKIGGQEFRFRAAIEPEQWAEYADWVSTPVADEVETVEKRLRQAGLLSDNGADAAEVDRRFEGAWGKIAAAYSTLAAEQAPSTQRQALDVLDRTVETYLVPDDRPKWKEIRRPGALEQPITDLDMIELIGYMTEATSGRPTQPSSASGPGDAKPGTTSMPGSPSPGEPSSEA